MRHEFERMEVIFSDRGKEVETWRDKYRSLETDYGNLRTKLVE